MKTKTLLVLVICFVAIMLSVSCGGTTETSPVASPSTSPVKESPEASKTPETPTASPLTDAEKQAAEYERIGQEALDNEHDHVWTFSYFSERHPHDAVYKCECDATGHFGSKFADFTMTIVGKSEKHPHYMVEECSICKGHFENENYPTELTWILAGYKEEHPHYGIVKCSQCDHSYINQAITSQNTGKSKLISTESTKDHPHYLIVQCTYQGCDHSYIEKNATAEFEIETDEDNYEIAHPHFLVGQCSHDGCSHTERINAIADWDWDDGVCSICGTPKYVSYIKTEDSAIITGRSEEPIDGEVIIPNMINGLPVVSIEPEAFSGDSEMHSIRIPESVLVIGTGAFKDCTQLNVLAEDMAPYELILGEIYDSPSSQPDVYSVITAGIIEAEAFKNCAKMETVIFGEGVQELHPMAFATCTNLKSLIFLSPIAPMITPDVFMNTPEELLIYVPAGSAGYDLPEWSDFEVIYFEIH